MAIWATVAGLFTGGIDKTITALGDAIDKNVTSDEERGKLKNELVQIAATAKKDAQDFELKVKELEVKQGETTQKDRDSAHNREIELAKLGRKNYIMLTLAVLAIFGMGWLTWFVFHNDIREREIAFLIIGMVIGIVKDIYGYYYGSSAGSAANAAAVRIVTKESK